MRRYSSCTAARYRSTISGGTPVSLVLIDTSVRATAVSSGTVDSFDITAMETYATSELHMPTISCGETDSAERAGRVRQTEKMAIRMFTDFISSSCRAWPLRNSLIQVWQMRLFLRCAHQI